MPTAYTQFIIEGASFKEFVMACARNFGACVTLKEEPISTEMPTIQPSTYHRNRLDGLRRELKHLESLTYEDATVLCQDEYWAAEASRKSRLIANRAQLSKYRKMLSKVQGWKPPTTDHIFIKEFMEDQIMKCIKHDDSSGYLSEPSNMQLPTDWLAGKKRKCLEDIEYHKEAHEKEINRTLEANKWLKALYESIEDQQRGEQ